MRFTRSKVQWGLAVLFLAVGLVSFIAGAYLQTRNPRTNSVDSVSWCALAVDTSLIAAGLSLPFMRPAMVVVIATVSPLVGFALASCLFWAIYVGYGNYKTWGHQEFAANGVAQIEPAAQMDKLYDDCRHYITYSGRDTVSTWNAVAYFGGRYVLTMQVPVEIESRNTGKIVGEPRFYLLEVEKVSISASGQVSASFSRGHQFGSGEWQTVFRSHGDFATIGFQMRTSAPVVGFDSYARASR
jgi:hypothetical protein